jgi:hypothetical protein
MEFLEQGHLPEERVPEDDTGPSPNAAKMIANSITKPGSAGCATTSKP